MSVKRLHPTCVRVCFLPDGQANRSDTVGALRGTYRPDIGGFGTNWRIVGPSRFKQRPTGLSRRFAQGPPLALQLAMSYCHCDMCGVRRSSREGLSKAAMFEEGGGLRGMVEGRG